MTLAQIESILDDGLALVGKLAPLAAVAGPAAGAAGALVGQIATFASTVVPQITADAEIIGSGDVTKITALQAQLEAANASLAAQVAAS